MTAVADEPPTPQDVPQDAPPARPQDSAAVDPTVIQAIRLDDASRRRRTRGRIVWIVVLLALAGAAVPTWKYFTTKEPIEYLTADVTNDSLTISVTATGTLQPVNVVEVGAEVSGRIIRVAVRHNDEVQAGAVLAEIDTEQQDAQVLRSTASVQAAEASLAQAEATIAEAQAALLQADAGIGEADAAIAEARATLAEAQARSDRADRLLAKDAVAAQDVEAARAGHARAEAGVTRALAGRERAVASKAASVAGETRARAAQASAVAQVGVAKATLEADRTTLGKALIRSPIDGIVLSRLVEPGQTVAASFQTPVLFSLAEDLRRMELHVDVDEADVGHVVVGQTAEFTVDAFPSRRFPARITELRNAARTVQGVVTYEAILSVDNSDLALRPGMTATAQIVVDQRNDIQLVPNGALRFRPPASVLDEGKSWVERRKAARSAAHADTPHVWLLEGGTPVRHEVQIGQTDGIRTELVGGKLPPGAQLITDVLQPDEESK